MIIKAVFKTATGIIFIILGLIGWIIPIIPGWPLLIPGIILLAPKTGRKIKEELEKRRK